jgi:hypothetical protein
MAQLLSLRGLLGGGVLIPRLSLRHRVDYGINFKCAALKNTMRNCIASSCTEAHGQPRSTLMSIQIVAVIIHIFLHWMYMRNSDLAQLGRCELEKQLESRILEPEHSLLIPVKLQLEPGMTCASSMKSNVHQDQTLGTSHQR